MGSAIAEHIKSKYGVLAFDNDTNKTKNLSGIKVATDNIDLLKNSDTVILAVKPQDFEVVLNEIKDYAKDKLIISIAAGKKTKYIERVLGKARVVRGMPNLPAKVGRGMICLCKGRYAKKNDLDIAKQLFGKLGKVLILKEKMMDASTAISGSGPGYFYYKLEGKSIDEIKNITHTFASSLTASAQEIGFSYLIARTLAETTTRGSIAYLEETKLSSAEAKKQVVSKGGTTAAGLEVLRRGGSLTEAVKAALKRAEELSKS